MEELSDSMLVNLSGGGVEDEGEWSDESGETRNKKRDSWVDAGSLSEELRLLDEEQKKQIEEARQWLEEEEAADEMLRRDLDELQLAGQRNHELSARLIAPEPEVPPEVQEKMDLLDKTVKTLQEQLNDRNVKLSSKNDSYSELLAKFNTMSERLLNTDREFKQTLARVKGEYLDLEKMLRGKMKTYQDLNKQLELELNERETEVIGLHDKLTDYEKMKESVSTLQDKLNDTTKSVNHLNKIVVALKGKLKAMKAEKDALIKERNNAEPVEPLKLKIVELEGNIAQLLEERKKFEDIESLKNRITLLEEEKGNLQLQLVDLDELKDSAESVKLLKENLEKEKSELEVVLEDVKQQNVELLSGKEEALKMFEEQETAINKLKSALQATTEDKIAAVMKAVELEESLTQKEKEIFYLKDALKILEAEKAETSKQLRPDGDSELLSDYNLSNGLQVKLTVLENELASCKENEMELTVMVRELEASREELEAQLRAAAADKVSAQAAYVVDSSQKELEARLSEALRQLDEQRNIVSELEAKLSALDQENVKLSKSLSEKEGSSSEATTQKLKKLAAVYKKRCGDMEVELENLRAELSAKKEEVRYQDIINETKKLEHELAELYIFINEFNHLSTEHISQFVNPSKVENALKLLSSWLERTGTTLPSSDWIPRSSDADLQGTLTEYQAAIKTLENINAELNDKLSASTEELKMLRELYEKESDKNGQFQTDLIALEAEMSEGKMELFSRLEEATKTLQDRENYIEVLEQDIVNMKTKMFSIESGMDSRHRELKERAQTMISKLEEAELMSKGFDKYKTEIDGQLSKLTESEKTLKEQLLDVQAKLEVSEEDAATTKLRNAVLENEKIQMESELNTLRDVRIAYNDTLDKIEELNGELKEAMEGFEAKNTKLDLLESERQELINKLTDLEDGFGDLEKKLEDSEKENGVLKMSIQSASKALEQSQHELAQARLELTESGRSNVDLIQKEVRELDAFYQDKINVLTESKEKLESLLSRKNDEVTNLQVKYDHLSTEYTKKSDECEELRKNNENQFFDEENWGDNLMPATQDSKSEAELLKLRTEKDQALEELNALKINYKKVLKKLKDLKNEKSKAQSGFSDLEMALQEELRNENDALQTKMAEIVKNNDILKKERESLSKRVDTLTSANEQLVDMKERQDVEVQMWQKRSSELNERLQQVQWSLDEIQFHGSEDEVSAKCKALTAENAELSKALKRKSEELELAIAREQDLEKEIEDLKANFDNIEKTVAKHEEAIPPNPAAFFEAEQEQLSRNALVVENAELSKELNRRSEELQLAIAREQDLQKENQQLKANFDMEQTVKQEQTCPPSTAAFFEEQQDQLRSNALAVENAELSKALNARSEELQMVIAREQDLLKEIQQLKASFAVARQEETCPPRPAPFFEEQQDQLRSKSDALVVENQELRTVLKQKNDELALAIALKEKLERQITDLKAKDVANVPTASAFFEGNFGSSEYNLLKEEHSKLQAILNAQNEELACRVAREQQLEQEISVLKGGQELEIAKIYAVSSAPEFFKQPNIQNPLGLLQSYNALQHQFEQLQRIVSSQNDELALRQDRERKLEKEISDLKANNFTQQENPPTAASFFDDLNPNEAAQCHDYAAECIELRELLSRKNEELALVVSREQQLEQEIWNLKANVSHTPTGLPNASTLFEITNDNKYATLVDENTKLQSILNSKNEEVSESLLKNLALAKEHAELKAILAQKNEELELAISRQSDLENELFKLKGHNQMAAPPTTDVPNAAVLFQGTASSFDTLFPSSADVPTPDSNLKTDMETRISVLTEENGRLAQQIEQTGHIASDKESKLLQLENQVASQKAYFDEQVQDLERNFQKALLDRDEDNAHLVCTVSAKDQALSAATQELSSLKEQLVTLGELELKLSHYEKDNFNLQSEISGLKNYIEASQNSTENEHANVILELKNRISTLENERNGVTNLLQEKDTQIEKLNNFLKQREEELQSCRVQIDTYMQEIEKLKTQDAGDAKILATLYELTSANQDLQVTINNQTELLRDKDNVILQLQNDVSRLETTVQTTSSNLNETKNSLGFLEEERLRLESLVQSRLDEVARYEEEIQRLKTTTPAQSSQSNLEDAASYVALIAEKDAEIARLTKSVIEIQERLLLSEQGKLNPQLRVVQAELDKALYTVHLRDVRIEELTLEIRQLVEERDLLQLSLSDALRKAEPSRIDSPPKLQIKERLSELHAAGYKKDPLVQSEREARHAQHMELYTGRTSPQEEQAADYGIFNWFFGGSSPAAPAGQIDVSDNS